MCLTEDELKLLRIIGKRVTERENCHEDSRVFLCKHKNLGHKRCLPCFLRGIVHLKSTGEMFTCTKELHDCCDDNILFPGENPLAGFTPKDIKKALFVLQIMRKKGLTKELFEGMFQKE